MKIIRQKQTRNNTVILTVEISSSESLCAFDASGNYKLSYPIDDIVFGHEIIEASRVIWCSVEQKWIES